MHGGLYLANKMELYGGPHTTLTFALLGGLYSANILERYRGRQTLLTIAFYGGLYIHYNGPLWRAPHCPYYSLAYRPLLS
jgi:hypothetical protein